MTEAARPSRRPIEASGDHWALEFALVARWPEYIDLKDKWENFKPMPAEELRAKVAAEFRDMPTQDGREEFIELQVQARADPSLQRHLALGEPIQALYVTSLMLSHALCEAMINLVMSATLAQTDRHEIFVFAERATFLEKWIAGPRLWNDKFAFPKGGALFETLRFLNEERNAFLHHKVAITIDGKQITPRKVKGLSMPAMLDWTARFLSLPYDLADLLWRSERSAVTLRLLREAPIARSPLHAKDLPGG